MKSLSGTTGTLGTVERRNKAAIAHASHLFGVSAWGLDDSSTAPRLFASAALIRREYRRLSHTKRYRVYFFYSTKVLLLSEAIILIVTKESFFDIGAFMTNA